MGEITLGVLRYAKWDYPPDDSKLRKLKRDFTTTRLAFDKLKREIGYGTEAFEYAYCTIEGEEQAMDKYNLGMLIAVLEGMTQQVAVAVALLENYSELEKQNYNNNQQAIDTQNLQKKELEEKINRTTKDLEKVIGQETAKAQERFSHHDEKVERFRRDLEQMILQESVKIGERIAQLDDKIGGLARRLDPIEEDQGKFMRFMTVTETRIAAIVGGCGVLFSALSFWINWKG